MQLMPAFLLVILWANQCFETLGIAVLQININKLTSMKNNIEITNLGDSIDALGFCEDAVSFFSLSACCTNLAVSL